MKHYKLTLDDAHEAQKLIARWDQKLLLPAFAVFVGVMVLVNIHNTTALSVILPLCLIIVFAYSFYTQQKKSETAEFASNRLYQETISVTIQDEYIEWKQESTTFRLRWQDVYSYKQNDRIFLIYLSIREARFIPMRVFDTEQEKDVLLNHLIKGIKEGKDKNLLALVPQPSKNSIDDENGNCKQCGHPANPHIVISQDPKHLHGIMRCPVENCNCFMDWDAHYKES